MAHLKEITKYKNKIMEAICTNQEIVNLLKQDTDTSDITGKDMRYKRIFPYNYVPLVAEQAQTFVCFAVIAPVITKELIIDYKLVFWVFTHQDLMRTPNGMRTDLIVSEIDKMLNGNTKYGLGKVKLVCLDIMNVPSRGYSGLYMEYNIQDLGRGCE